MPTNHLQTGSLWSCSVAEEPSLPTFNSEQVTSIMIRAPWTRSPLSYVPLHQFIFLSFLWTLLTNYLTVLCFGRWRISSSSFGNLLLSEVISLLCYTHQDTYSKTFISTEEMRLFFIRKDSTHSWKHFLQIRADYVWRQCFSHMHFWWEVNKASCWDSTLLASLWIFFFKCIKWTWIDTVYFTILLYWSSSWICLRSWKNKDPWWKA